MDIVIAHISDPHVGTWRFLPEKFDACIDEVNRLSPDIIVVTGDLTMFGYESEYREAKKYFDRFKKKALIIPGNHDARYCGDKNFDKYFGFGNKLLKVSDKLRIVGIDSAVPDLDEGTVGRGKQRWLKKELEKIPKDVYKVVAIHHHLIPIPDTGRERNILTDAGDVLGLLTNEKVDLVLSGHRHTPWVWDLNDMPVITAGSTSSEKLRAGVTQSYNIIELKDNCVDIKVKEIGGEEKLLKSCRINRH